jgi:hypothetical protein
MATCIADSTCQALQQLVGTDAERRLLPPQAAAAARQLLPAAHLTIKSNQ